MKKLLVIGLGIVAFLVIAVLAAPFLIPVDSYKGRIAEQVERATGRALRIDGPLRLSLFPRLQLEAERVALANAPGAAAPALASLGKLQVQIELMPLLSGQVAIDRFVLVDPVIRLEVDRQGRPNWQLDMGGRPAAPASTADGPPAGGAPAPGQLRLGDVRLVNGTIGYLDHRTGTAQELTRVDAAVSLSSLEGPFGFEGCAIWRERPIKLKLDVAKPRELMDGRSSTIAFKLAAQVVTVDFAGVMANAQPVRIEGGLQADIASVRDLADWTGNPLAPGGGMGRATLAGKLTAIGPRLSLGDAAITFDALQAKGTIAADMTPARPSITGKLELPMLDLDPYLAAAAPPAGTPAQAPAPAPGAAAASGWSTEPLRLTGLKAADATLALTLGGLRLQKIELGRAVLDIALKDGRLVADLKEMALYQGSGQARVALDGAAPVPAVEVTAKLAGIQAAPVLKALADIDRLSGTGAFELAVTGRGQSQRELVGALNGRGSFTFRDGAIKGINIGAMARNIGSAFQGAGSQGAEQTDFSELSATYVIADGILRNTDLQLKSPLLRVDGAGSVDLPRRTLDYRLTPKLVATAQGQGGRNDLAGVTVPVVIQGPWSAPSYKPDLAGLVEQNLRDPSRLIESLRGRPPAAGGAGAPTGRPVDALRGILGR